MILESTYLPKYGLDNTIQKFHTAIDYFNEVFNKDFPNGKYTIVEEKLIAIVTSYPTLTEKECIWESHKKFIDVQYMLFGSEQFGCTPIENLSVSKPYSKENDCIFYNGDGPEYLLNEGMFVVFYSNDAHKPGILINVSSTVKKLILKIDKNYLPEFDPKLIQDYFLMSSVKK